MDTDLPASLYLEDQASVEQFATSHLNVDRLKADSEGTFQTNLWRECASHGILRWACPEEYNGLGKTALETSQLLESLGFGCRNNGLLFSLGTQLWGIQKTILKFGSEQQKSHFLTENVDGSLIGSFAINEASSGSDAISLDTTAKKEGSDYILEGEKTLISMAPVADFALVFANTNPEAGRWGISVFIIDKETPGIVMHPADEMMGLRTAPVGKISLRSCRVPNTCLLGKEGSGGTIFNFAQICERSMLLAPQIGTMRRQIDQCVDFAKSRVRGGQQIGKYQAVSRRIADMAIRLETSRLLQHKAASLIDKDKYDIFNAAIVKTHISEAFEINSREMLSVMGGSGYLTEQGVDNDLRDAIGGTVYGGTTDMQRNIISGILGL